MLQVHGVANPRQGLFNPADAIDWIQRWSRTSSRPFRVAVPSYGSRVTWNEAGRVSAVESEAPRYSNLVDGQELVARPVDVANVINTVGRLNLPNLRGFVWFRLPIADDHRAWTRRTWQAVIRGTARPADVRIELVPTGAAGTSCLTCASMFVTTPARSRPP